MDGFRRALVISTADRYFSLAANLVGLAVVSRLLTPSEIGVSVIGMAIAAFAQSVRELATTNFIIQRQTLSQHDVRVTFTILMLVTVVIVAIIALSAGVLAHLYSEPRLRWFLYIAALAILMELISAPIAALLRREMAIGKLAIITSTGDDHQCRIDNHAGCPRGKLHELRMGLARFDDMDFLSVAAGLEGFSNLSSVPEKLASNGVFRYLGRPRYGPLCDLRFRSVLRTRARIVVQRGGALQSRHHGQPSP